MDEPGAGPVLEFEALLKVAFADHGDLNQLRANLGAIHVRAKQRVDYVDERAREYEETGGPFPERLPVIALVVRFHLDLAEMMQRWAQWAEEEIATWSGVTPGSGASLPP